MFKTILFYILQTIFFMETVATMGKTQNHRLHLHQHPQQHHHHHHLARDAGVDGDGYNEGEKGECCGDRGEDGRGHLMMVGNIPDICHFFYTGKIFGK